VNGEQHESGSHARAVLGARGLRPKKHYGQNFLMDGGSVTRIADLALLSREMPLIEVGPGTGVLTRALASRADSLTVVEVDGDMVEILREDSALKNVNIVHADALTFSYRDAVEGKPWAATGNLPYNVGTQLLMQWIESEHPPERITVMLQRDVADRIVAKSGTAAYGSLTLAVSLVMHARRAFTLGPGVFYPRPKVDSSVLVLERRAEPLVSGTLLISTRAIVRAAFAYRRKTLANSLMLALGIERTRSQAALHSLGLDMEIRGEQLDLGQYVALAGALATSEAA
jgi:16S rRNA (adenine1518-N6/adenine1519-N6)-dimethyltransferase